MKNNYENVSLLKKIKLDCDYRTKFFLLLSFIFNIIYSIFLFVVSQIFFSKWFFVMAVYYGLLSMVRVFIFLKTRKYITKNKEILIMRAIGCFLFVLNLLVSIMMFLLIYTTQYVQHHEITVITLATYTFAMLTVAIIDVIKYLKYDNYVFSSIKVINLISASISIATLTNTMLTTFGNGDTNLRNIMLPILCASVSIFIIFCAIMMIIKANKELRLLKNE